MSQFSTLPLWILGYEGPSLRAYMACMHRLNLRPAGLLLMVLKRHPATRRPIGGLLPRRLRTWYARKAQERYQNHWPRQLQARHPALLAGLTDALADLLPEPAPLIDRMLHHSVGPDDADHFQQVLVDGLSDPALPDALARIAPAPVLFTGGGILSPKLLSVPGIRFMHVHPGILPGVRGADGMLWSMLLQGRPGFSAFYMAPGLDTGDIIATRAYPPLQVRTPLATSTDDALLYRALFAFADPLLRADFLMSDVLTHARLADRANLAALPAASQDARQGLTYHFMHPALRRLALDRIFLARPARHQSPSASSAGSSAASPSSLAACSAGSS